MHNRLELNRSKRSVDDQVVAGDVGRSVGKEKRQRSNQYFTIASHGFVTGAGVRHLLGNNRIIGIMDKKFGETDISLCCITDSQINYTVDSFAVSNDAIMLRKMVKEEVVWIGKELFFNSPITGLGTGYVVAHGTRAIPALR